MLLLSPGINYDRKQEIITVIATSVAIILLMLFVVGIGMKLYFDKVSGIISNCKKFFKRFNYTGNWKKNAKEEIARRLGGNPNGINPDLPIEYQIEFLPYDKRWEFPRNRLTLGFVYSNYPASFHVLFFAKPNLTFIQGFNSESDVLDALSKLKQSASKIRKKLSKQWPSKWLNRNLMSLPWMLLLGN